MNAPAPPSRFALREMTHDDLGAVRRIERRAYTDAWSRRVFEQELGNALARYEVAVVAPPPAGHPARLRWPRRDARRPEIVGFFGVWFMQDQLHLVTVAVDPPRQREGIGARMLLECFAIAGAAELASIVLEVRVSNERARALYERFGFRVVGRLAGYYKDDGDDAFVMTCDRLGEPASVEALERARAAHRAQHPELWPSPADATGGPG
ncbi:MAG: GNAT family N-acetyltransferase [Chloroflexi bacterium]|nr:GNAT family N-acetyltransferase [Chloroflexota bacterium]